jgi:catechol 2,3-dioxygenase-like lactoylglutathione lyase family enzyme
MAIQFISVVPILRIFDVAKADEFYQGYLGFKVDWDHRFDDNAPLYRQVSRGDLILHLSEHHGDGSPGARLRVMMRGVEEFHREISAKAYRYMRPGLERTPWGTLETGAVDPFGNLIRFCELIDNGDTRPLAASRVSPCGKRVQTPAELTVCETPAAKEGESPSPGRLSLPEPMGMSSLPPDRLRRHRETPPQPYRARPPHQTRRPPARGG